MARRTRIFFPGATHHIILRGNNGIPVFMSDEERCRFSLLMQEGVERFGHQIIAFCFMTNHIHLAIQVNDVSPSQIFHNLSFRYTQFFNREHKRVGHLFQARFKSILVDSDRYLRKLIRYIHLNPVRAGMVEAPQDYRWSSHRAFLGQDRFCWLATDIGLRQFENPHTSTVKAFHNYVLAGIGTEDGTAFSQGIVDGILGDKAYIESIGRRFAEPEPGRPAKTDLPTLASVVEQTYTLAPDELRRLASDRTSSHIRAVTAFLARECRGVTLEELATYMHTKPRTLGKAAARLAAKLPQSPALQQEIDTLLNQLTTTTSC